MEWLRITMVVLLLARAIYTDVKTERIENQSMLLGVVSGCLWSTLNGGSEGLFNSIRMIIIVLTVLFVFFLMRGLGAGDIKLLCVMVAFYPEKAIFILIAAFVVGAFIAIGKMGMRLVRRVPVYVPGETIHFSIPIAVGMLIVIGLPQMT